MSPLGGFDQVVAISQGKINNDLKARYEKFPTPLQRFKANSGATSDWAVYATFSPPAVELYLPEEPQKAILRLNFTDGHFDCDDGDFQCLSVKGWSLAFLANLSSSKLDTVPSELKGDIPDNVIDQIENARSYSLTQVLLDPLTANGVDIDFSRSSTPGLVASDAGDEAKKQVLESIMKAYFKELAEGRHNVLGYAVTAADSAPGTNNTPSLAPVSVSLQVMPCVTGEDVPLETRDRDALLFLEMIGDLTGRNANPLPLPGSYAWVPEGKVGTMIIHKDAFWKRFLANHLTFFISDAVRLSNTIAHWVQSEDWKGALSQDAPWIISGLGTDKRPNTRKWSVVGDHAAHFNWHGQKRVESSSPDSWISSVDELKDLHTDLSVIATIEPSTQCITIKTNIKYRYIDDRDYPVISETSDFTRSTNAEVEWVAKLVFNSVEGRTLDTKVEVGDIKSSCKAEVKKHGVLEKLFGEGKRPSTVVSEKVQKYLRENVKREQIEALANEGLKTRSHFVFSGPGGCVMKDPTFTRDHHLRVYFEAKSE